MKSLFFKITRWNIDILKLLLAITILLWTGKAEFDWLIEAMPLKNGTQYSNLLLIGSLLNETGCITPSVGPEPFTIRNCIYCLQKNPTIGFILVLVFHLDKNIIQVFSIRNDHQYLDFF
jgi:hypothetical protein